MRRKGSGEMPSRPHRGNYIIRKKGGLGYEIVRRLAWNEKNPGLASGERLVNISTATAFFVSKYKGGWEKKHYQKLLERAWNRGSDALFFSEFEKLHGRY